MPNENLQCYITTAAVIIIIISISKFDQRTVQATTTEYSFLYRDWTSNSRRPENYAEEKVREKKWKKEKKNTNHESQSYRNVSSGIERRMKEGSKTMVEWTDWLIVTETVSVAMRERERERERDWVMEWVEAEVQVEENLLRACIVFCSNNNEKKWKDRFVFIYFR